MKVVAFNGSPRAQGNTFQAIQMVANELIDQGIEVEIVQVGSQEIVGCKACGACARNRNERCIIDDAVNEWIQKMKQADGIILGSPVHYADISATMKAFLDRAFMSAPTRPCIATRSASRLSLSVAPAASRLLTS